MDAIGRSASFQISRFGEDECGSGWTMEEGWKLLYRMTAGDGSNH